MIHISRTNIWRGPRPKDLKVLRDECFHRIISFQSGWYELLTETKRERQFPCDFGLKFYDLGSSDIFPPDKRTVETALELLQRGGKTYVHCLSGVDRTGFIIAVYRMKIQGWDFERAHDEWVKLGRHFWFFWWKRELKKYAP